MDILCRCGHGKEDHPKVGRMQIHAGTVWGDYKICDGCFNNNRSRGIKQLGTVDCEKYIPDNLTYIERLAKARKLI
jgi:hypothetical protein